MKLFVFSCLLIASVDSDVNIGTYIINGKEAEEGQFPYQVGLRMHKGNTTSFCGGSLISPIFILTAAHCLDKWDAENITAYLGSIHYGEGIRKVGRLKTVHPKFNHNYSAKSFNDIGLLKIDYVSKSESIAYIALPDISQSYSSYESRPTITSGWGRTNGSVNTHPSTLMYTEFLVISNTACAELLRHDTIPEDFICAASPIASGGCRGDSGGPLAHKDGTVTYIIGVLSRDTGKNCSGFYATIYTRVTSHRQWIKDHTGL